MSEQGGSTQEAGGERIVGSCSLRRLTGNAECCMDRFEIRPELLAIVGMIERH